MTREQIYWSLVLGVGVNIATWLVLQPLVSWAGKRVFDYSLSVNTKGEQSFYKRVARRHIGTSSQIYSGIMSVLLLVLFVGIVELDTSHRVATTVLILVVTLYAITRFV